MALPSSAAVIIESPSLGEALAAIASLPEHLGPTKFSDSEDGSGEVGSLADGPSFDSFRERNAHGFFLTGESGAPLYDIASPGPRGLVTLTLYFQDAVGAGDATVLFRSLEAASPLFGFAASDEEYCHRNRVSIDLGESVMESWVGRNLGSYLPGLYWLTLVSRSHCTELGVDLARLMELPELSSSSLGPDLVLLQTCGRAADWKDCKDVVDEICARESAIFSTRSVFPAIKGPMTFADANAVVSKWR